MQRARGSCVSGCSQEPQEAGVHAVHQVQGESEGTSSGLECSGSHRAMLLVRVRQGSEPRTRVVPRGPPGPGEAAQDVGRRREGAQQVPQEAAVTVARGGYGDTVEPGRSCSCRSFLQGAQAFLLCYLL